MSDVFTFFLFFLLAKLFKLVTNLVLINLKLLNISILVSEIFEILNKKMLHFRQLKLHTDKKFRLFSVVK